MFRQKSNVSIQRPTQFIALTSTQFINVLIYALVQALQLSHEKKKTKKKTPLSQNYEDGLSGVFEAFMISKINFRLPTFYFEFTLR